MKYANTILDTTNYKQKTYSFRLQQSLILNISSSLAI